MRKDILSLTIKEAIRLAEMYEDDIYWDIWNIESCHTTMEVEQNGISLQS